MKFLRALDELDSNINGNEWEKIAKEVGKSENEVKVTSRSMLSELSRDCFTRFMLSNTFSSSRESEGFQQRTFCLQIKA